MNDKNGVLMKKIISLQDIRNAHKKGIAVTGWLFKDANIANLYKRWCLDFINFENYLVKK